MKVEPGSSTAFPYTHALLSAGAATASGIDVAAELAFESADTDSPMAPKATKRSMGNYTELLAKAGATTDQL